MYYLKNDFRIKWKEKNRWLRVTNPVRKLCGTAGLYACKGRSQPYSVGNYGWIFTKRLPGMDGYVRPR